MRNHAILFTLLLSNLLTACGDDLAPPLSINFKSGHAPALVVFRDGLDAPWQAATMRTPTSFEAEVHDSYVVTAVCEDPATGRSRTLQFARTIDDSHNLMLSCDLTAPSEHLVTGHMMQAGFVQLGSSSDSSEIADWDFQLSVVGGSYDLIATTAERIAMRRSIEVNGDLAMTSPIDVAAEGTALVDVAFTATNATPDETLIASVDLTTQSTQAARVYLGPAATAKAARDLAFLEDATQTAAVRATSGTALRELKRPFQVGDDTAYKLPDSLGGVQWEIDHGQISTNWTTLPELDHLDMSASSSAAEGTPLVTHELTMTPQFLAATGITHLAIDTEIPGYKPAWRIDFTGHYIRKLIATHAVNAELATSAVTEDVNVPPPSEHSTLRTSSTSAQR